MGRKQVRVKNRSTCEGVAAKLVTLYSTPAATAAPATAGVPVLVQPAASDVFSGTFLYNIYYGVHSLY